MTNTQRSFSDAAQSLCLFWIIVLVFQLASLLLFATKVEVLLNCVLLFLMFLSPGMTQFNVLFFKDVASWVNLYLADSQASTQSKKIEFGSVACLNIRNITNVDFNRKQLLEKTN